MLILLSTSTCEKDKADETGNEDFAVFDISEESEWDYWLIANKDKSYLLVDKESSSIGKVFFRPDPDHEGYSVFLDDGGLPERAIINDHIFLFGNFKGNTLDIAVIDPSGDIKIARDIESDYDFDDMTRKATSTTDDWRDMVKIAGMASSVAACGIGIATAVTGVGIAVAAVGCGATALMLTAELMPDEQEILGLSAATIGAFSTALGCANTGGITCALGVASEAGTITHAAVSMQEENSEIINNAEEELSNVPRKMGDFAITGGRYGIYEDWDAAVKEELGNGYRPLEWHELKEYYNQGSEILALFDGLGLTEYRNGAAILRNGRQRYSSTRGYFASRHEHDKPGNYLAHDHIDNYLISLGSWDGERKILARKD